MKKIFAALLATLFFATGCFNATEELNIGENGAGVYAIKMDMSGMFDFIKGMQGEDNGATSDALKQANMDTTIRFASFTDTAATLTAEEKALIRDATMHMTMNESKKQFLIHLAYPYKRLEDIQRILKISQRSGNMMEKAMGGNQNDDNGDEQPQPDFNSFYSLNFSNGLLEKKVDNVKLAEMQNSEQFEQIKQSSAMLGEASMNTVIQLPRKVKKAEGAGVKVSEDGKTVTVAASFADMFDNPKLLTYRIEY